MNDPLLARLLSDDPPREAAVVRLLVELGLQVIRADEGSLAIVDDGPPEALVFALTVGPTGRTDALRGTRIGFHEGVMGLAAATGDTQIGAPVLRDVGRHSDHSGAATEVQHVIAAPVYAGAEVVGVLSAVRFDDVPFTAADALLYGRMGAVSGVVIDQARRLARWEGDAGPQAAIHQAAYELAATAPGREDAVVRTLRALTAILAPDGP